MVHRLGIGSVPELPVPLLIYSHVEHFAHYESKVTTMFGRH